MTKHNKVCGNCKSKDIVVDAWAEWDADKDEFVLRSVFDAAYCIDCEEACDVEEVEIVEHLGDFEDAKGCLPIENEDK